MTDAKREQQKQALEAAAQKLLKSVLGNAPTKDPEVWQSALSASYEQGYARARRDQQAGAVEDPARTAQFHKCAKVAFALGVELVDMGATAREFLDAMHDVWAAHAGDVPKVRALTVSEWMALSRALDERVSELKDSLALEKKRGVEDEDLKHSLSAARSAKRWLDELPSGRAFEVEKMLL